MTSTTTIELPRLENERPERYEARTLYLTMGGSRSIEAVRQKIGKRSARRLEEWSREDNWVALAADYDQTVYTLAAQDAANRYRADLEAHREQAMASSKNLLALASGLTRIMADALQQPQKIIGKDGKPYTLHKIMADANTLTTIIKAVTAALDLQAHALGVDQMMSILSDDSE